VYILVSIVVVGAVPKSEVIKAEEYALAVAAKPFLHEWGFVLITIGALVSTSSALNSALYGGANVAYALAKKGMLPKVFDRRTWFGEPEGLYITAGLGLFLAIFLNLSGIAEVTTLAFILIYLAVALSHWRLKEKTKGNPKIILASIIILLFSFAIILSYSLATNLRAFGVAVVFLGGAVLFEFFYRKITGRVMKTRTQIRPLGRAGESKQAS
jgi:amino acid transporter